MKSIPLLIMLAISTNIFCQQNPPVINTEYLKKSKTQKKIAFIMLGGGAALFLTGIVIPKGELVHSGFLGDDYKNDGIKGGLELTGIISMLVSIPLFIASSKNKKKAMSVSFKNNPSQQIQRGSFVNRSVPSLTFKIHL